jgi:nucleotide-binding universal stress UspA family protein
MSYNKILLCVDSSQHSDFAVDCAALIARACGSEVVATHVYAARLHDRRFMDLEPGLPQEYQDPKRLEASRQTHDSLIGKGLRMISDSYIKAVRDRLNGIAVDGRSIEGKNYVELAAESANGYDLAVIGARGLGLASLDSECPAEALGSVCERFCRRCRTDVLVVKNAGRLGGNMLACVDGSSESYAALRKALRLAKAVGGRVEAVTCFDPDYHPVAFEAIAKVLSEKDAKMFRFKEQEKLHDQIINKGLENLYRGYLDNARIVAKGRGQPLETRLLTGKPAYGIASLVRKIEPALVVVGRFGLHRTDESDLGNTAETVVRLATTNVLVVNEEPEKADLPWTAEARARLEKVPEFMRPMVAKAIESHARARGLEEVTAEVVTEAKTGHGVPMPGH